MKVWCVRADFGRYAELFREGGYASLDYSIEEPMEVGSPREKFIELYKKYNPKDTSNVAIGQQSGQLFRFMSEIRPDDYIVTPSSDIDTLFYGVVLDEPYFFDSQPADGCPYRHRRPVRWFKETVSRNSFSVPFQQTIRSSLTIFNISQASEFLSIINAEGFKSEKEPPAFNLYESVLERVLLLDDKEFEILAKDLLSAVGFEATEVTGGVGDGGVDATGILNVFNIAEIKIHVQAKRYKRGSRINKSTVKQLRSSIPAGALGAFITTADFQKNAYEAATEDGFPRIGLVNGEQLVHLLIEHWDNISEEFREKLGLKRGLVLA